MRLVETDHMICFNQLHGLFGTCLTLCRSTLLGGRGQAAPTQVTSLAPSPPKDLLQPILLYLQLALNHADRCRWMTTYLEIPCTLPNFQYFADWS